MASVELVVDMDQGLYVHLAAYAEQLDVTPEDLIVQVLEEKLQAVNC